MPRYQITAPDGRQVVVEGDRPPTSDDARKIFSQLPERTPKAVAPVIAVAEAGESPASGRSLEGGILGEIGLPMGATTQELRGGGVVADIATEGGGATVGQVVGAAAGPIGIPIGGAIGGGLGNYAAQQRRIAAGEQESVRPGELLSSILTGAIPGAPLASAGPRAILREGGKQAAAGLAGRNIQTLVDEGRLATPIEGALSTVIPAAGGATAQRIQAANPEIQAAAARSLTGPDTQKRATLAAAQEAGLFAVPSDVNPSWLNKRLESAAGPADIRRGVALKNQVATNAIAANDLGLPEGTEITIPVIRALRAEASEPYRDLAALGAGGDVDALRNAQFTRNENYKHYASGNGGPEALRRARDAQVEIDDIEGRLETTAVTLGRPELVDRLRAGRERIAKTYDVEAALNLGDSNVSAPILGRRLDQGKPLSGGLETIGRFAQTFPRSIPEGASILPVGLSKTELITGGMLGGGGILATGDPRYAAAILAPVAASTAARRLVLSEPYLRSVANMPPPRVNASPDQIAAAIRLLSQAAGSNEEAARFFASAETMAPQTTLSRP